MRFSRLGLTRSSDVPCRRWVLAVISQAPSTIYFPGKSSGKIEISSGNSFLSSKNVAHCGLYRSCLHSMPVDCNTRQWAHATNICVCTHLYSLRRCLFKSDSDSIVNAPEWTRTVTPKKCDPRPPVGFNQHLKITRVSVCRLILNDICIFLIRHIIY